MNFSSARKLTGEETKEELKCIRCGDRPNIVQIMLDPRRGKTLRMYECRCGERIWDDYGRRLRYRKSAKYYFDRAGLSLVSPSLRRGVWAVSGGGDGRRFLGGYPHRISAPSRCPNPSARRGCAPMRS